MTTETRPKIDRDATLLAALRAETPEAPEMLVDTYGDRVYRLTHRITGSNEDAEEATQDALWTAARKISSFKGESQFGSWLYRIAANAAYQKLRARRAKTREIAIDDVLPAFDNDGLHFEPMDDWAPRVDDNAVNGELRDVLEKAIAELPPDYRTALVMHDVEGMPNPDIAETLGISLPAVKSRVHRPRFTRTHSYGEVDAPGSGMVRYGLLATHAVTGPWRHEPEGKDLTSMEAVIATGGKQYRVTPGQIISVEKLPGDAGGPVEFHSVLLVTRDGGEIVSSADGLKSARVSGEVVRQGRTRKVSVVKFRRRKNYRRNRGHRQAATTVRITNIEV